ncbi:hypothetical protein [Microcystis phage Mel-JY01]
MAPRVSRNSRNLIQIAKKNEMVCFKITRPTGMDTEQYDEISKYISSVLLMKNYWCVIRPGTNIEHKDSVNVRYVISFDMKNSGTLQNDVSEIEQKIRAEFLEHGIEFDAVIKFDIFYGNNRDNIDERLSLIGGVSFYNEYKDTQFSTFEEYSRLSKMVIVSIYKNGWKIKNTNTV